MPRHLLQGMAVMVVGLCLAFVAFGGNARKESAATEKGTREGGRLMHLMDADGDNKISPAEYKAWRYRVAHRRFAAADASRDGKIDFNEFLQQHSDRERARFYWLDTANKGFVSDGIIDRAEAAEEDMRPAVFAKCDTNGDGKIDWTEWNNVWLANEKTKFAKHDANGDGVLDFAEAFSKLDDDIVHDFKDYDTDSDGFINETEFVAVAVSIAREKAERLFNEIDED